MSLAVLDLLLTPLFGSEGPTAVAAKDAVEAINISARVQEKSGGVSHKSPAHGDEILAAVEELKQQIYRHYYYYACSVFRAAHFSQAARVNENLSVPWRIMRADNES